MSKKADSQRSSIEYFDEKLNIITQNGKLLNTYIISNNMIDFVIETDKQTQQTKHTKQEMRQNMLKMYKNLARLASLYPHKDADLSTVALQYQQVEDPIYVSFAFCKLFPVMIRQVERYYTLTNEEKASFCLEELRKAMLDFKPDKGAKLMTLFVTYLRNRLRTESESESVDKRRANVNTECFDIALVRTSYIESAYDVLEYLESLNQMSLTRNELRYCEIVVKSNGKVKDIDIAKILGISSSAIKQIKDRLAKKLVAI